jgi:hypothetical protein
LKSKEQREGAETIAVGQQEKGGTSKVVPNCQERMDVKVGNFSF